MSIKNYLLKTTNVLIAVLLAHIVNSQTTSSSSTSSSMSSNTVHSKSSGINDKMQIGDDSLAYFKGQAFAAEYNGDYKKAGDLFEKAYPLKKRTGEQWYDLAGIWTKAGNKDKAFNYLNKAMMNNFRGIAYTMIDRKLKSLYEDPRWNKFIDKFKTKTEAEFKKNLSNYNLSVTLREMYQSDQGVRFRQTEVTKEKGGASTEAKELMAEMANIDKENIQKLVLIIEEHGWPTKKMVGEEGCLGAFFVLQHAPLMYQEKYYTMVMESTERGDIPLNYAALFIDRVLVRKGKAQLYGTQLTLDKASGKWIPNPIEDIENVNTRRAKADMPPLKKIVEGMGMKYDEFLEINKKKLNKEKE